MISIRRSAERGHADHGWLKTYHTFSFADYQDPAHHSFRALRVMNEDWVAPGQGFGTHPHRDMEIITYVLEGTLQHKDSMGNGTNITPGEFQRMSAGTGILHSEFNPSADETVHLYQIWLFPKRKGITPSYEQRRFDPASMRNRLRLVASPDGRDDSLTIQQDAFVYAATLDAGSEVRHELAEGRSAYLQVLRGSVVLAPDGETLVAGDGVRFTEASAVTFAGGESAEVLLFDL